MCLSSVDRRGGSFSAWAGDVAYPDRLKLPDLLWILMIEVPDLLIYRVATGGVLFVSECVYFDEFAVDFVEICVRGGFIYWRSIVKTKRRTLVVFDSVVSGSVTESMSDSYWPVCEARVTGF
ncbi:hypothetical protein F2Q69_00016681 [Brassica cretica]|uniref:Uncharacterized protein n=1 Tax=Brassica cretica TaxID=69181 RepID=A0A8S9QTG3_BRACR|nr:hypothetical protein F2Q69_00016681 [Brassica cretica]